METSDLKGANLIMGIDANVSGDNGVLIMQKNGIIRVQRFKKKKRKKVIS